jgi:IS30 family transposase
MANKKVNIDWSYIGELCEAGCSGVEIASKLGIHQNTIYQRCKTDLNIEFVEFSQQKKQSGEALIKKTQFDMAVKDKDKTMLIWLGKNRLGQKDKQQTEVKINEPDQPMIIIYKGKELDISK